MMLLKTACWEQMDLDTECKGIKFEIECRQTQKRVQLNLRENCQQMHFCFNAPVCLMEIQVGGEDQKDPIIQQHSALWICSWVMCTVSMMVNIWNLV